MLIPLLLLYCATVVWETENQLFGIIVVILMLAKYGRGTESLYLQRFCTVIRELCWFFLPIIKSIIGLYLSFGGSSIGKIMSLLMIPQVDVVLHHISFSAEEYDTLLDRSSISHQNQLTRLVWSFPLGLFVKLDVDILLPSK